MLYCSSCEEPVKPTKRSEQNKYCSRCGASLTRPTLVKIFQYLSALSRQRYPVKREIDDHKPWVIWLDKDTLPTHPSFSYCPPEYTVDIDGDETNNIAEEDIADSPTEPDTAHSPTEPDTAHSPAGVALANGQSDFLLKVSHPQWPDPPRPPSEIIDWIRGDWDQSDGEIEVEAFLRGERFDAVPHRQRRLEEWLKRRKAWIEEEHQVAEVIKLYDILSQLRATIERESERWELLLGNGLLTWQRGDDKTIHYPLMLLRLRLIEEKAKEITLKLVEAGEPPTLCTEVFKNIPDIDIRALGNAQNDLHEGGWHPLGDEETVAFLKRLTVRMKARYISDPTLRKKKNIPYIEYAPVVFLRKRTGGLSAALDSIEASLKAPQGHISPALASIVGLDPPSDANEDTDLLGSHPQGEEDSFFLTKPANEEQLKILRRLAKRDAVLVQGPPGTGKTHTIANLIGHLLAVGKRVLVTSSTAKALKALQGQVALPLQSLCVSFLEDNSQLMKRAVQEITRYQASDQLDLDKQDLAGYEQRYDDLSCQLKATLLQLEDALYEEYCAISLPGKEYSPTEVARYLAEKSLTAGWIPPSQRRVKLGEPLPLSVEELSELYASNEPIAPTDEWGMALSLLNPTSLLPPDEFERLVIKYVQLASLPEETWEEGSEWWRGASADQASWDLGKLRSRVQEIKLFPNAAHWQLAATQAGLEDGPRRQVWEELIGLIESVKEQARDTALSLARYLPSFPENCLPSHLAEEVSQAICNYVREGGDLGNPWLFLNRRGWRTFLANARVKGELIYRIPSSHQLEALEAVRDMLYLRAARQALVARWRAQVTQLGGSDVGHSQEPEQICDHDAEIVHQCLEWFSAHWLPLASELRQYGFLLDAFLKQLPIFPHGYGNLLRLRHAIQLLPQLIAAEADRRAYKEVSDELRKLQMGLEQARGSSDTFQVVQPLLSAVKDLHPQRYRQAFEALTDLLKRREGLRRRSLLLERLAEVAPAWATAIRLHQERHKGPDLPGDPEEAWQWRQLSDELDRRAEVSLEELRAEIARVKAELQDVTAELVAKKVWVSLMNKITPGQLESLKKWVKLQNSSRTPRGESMRKKARQYVPDCQAVIPVWIMPLSRIMETFEPQQTHFDVVIIDEASQADATALAAISLGTKVIVVGDEEQVSPTSSIGRAFSPENSLMEEYLRAVPHNEFYDSIHSIYDLAQVTLRDTIPLREHFRCVTPIIQFSNRLSYQGDIRPLRDDSAVERQPFVVAYEVEDPSKDESATEDENKINKQEAVTIASLIAAAIEQDAYKKTAQHDAATFGVIAMVSGRQGGQAAFIDRLLHKHLGDEKCREQHLLCGTPRQFQGDERDVIFLSMVDMPRPKEGQRLKIHRAEVDGKSTDWKKIFNVAASRARDQMWVVHSLAPEDDLQDGDIRKELIFYAQNPDRMNSQSAKRVRQVAVDFERDISQRLLQEGYRVKNPWWVGTYRIALVIEGNGKRLAIACDGDLPPISREQLREDLARQATLEARGWRFTRILASQYFRDPAKALVPIYSTLRGLGIPPEGNESTANIKTYDGQDLLQWLTNRAKEIRQQWTNPVVESTKSR